MRGPAAHASCRVRPPRPGDVDAEQRAGHGVEAGGVDDDVELVLAGRRADAGRGDRLDRRLAQVDEVHVLLVEGGPVAGVDAEPLAADDLVGRELPGDVGVLDDLAQLLPHELRGQVVGRLVEQEVVVGAEEGEAAVAPSAARTLPGAPRRVTSRADRSVRSHAGAERGRHEPVLGAELRVLGLDLLHRHRVERLVPRRHRVGGRALEHRELGGLLGDDRDRLDGRRAGADHAHPLAGEVDALVGPRAGVVRRPLERVGAGDLGRVGGAEAAGGHDDEAGRHVVALVGADAPGAGGLVEGGGRHLRLELDVLAEVEAVGDVVGVGEDLGLRGVALGPLPLLLEVLVEAVGVLHALDVAARAGVAVPVPGAADAVAGLEHLHA